MNNNNAEITVESPKFVELPVITDRKDDVPIPTVSSISSVPSADGRATIIDPVNARLDADKGWVLCILMISVIYVFGFFLYLAMSMYYTAYDNTFDNYCDGIIYCANTPENNCCSANSTKRYCYQGSSSAPCVDIFTIDAFIQENSSRESFVRVGYCVFLVISVIICLFSSFCADMINKEKRKRMLDSTARNTSV